MRHRPYAPVRRGRSGLSWWRSRNFKVIAGAVGVVALLVFVMFLLGDSPQKNTHIVWIAEKSTAAPSGMPQALRDRIGQVAAEGTGTLDVYAVGQQYVRVGSIDLGVFVNGDTVPDADQRAAVLTDRFERLDAAMNATAVSSKGFSLYAMLQAGSDVSDERRPHEIWLSTTLLSATETPMAMSQLTAADPTPASKSVLGSVRDHISLQGVELHTVLLTPVGATQRPLSPEQEQWRSNFVDVLGRGLGATGFPPKHDGSTAAAWRESSRVPVIVVYRPIPPRHSATEDREVKLDTVSFVPDEARLLDPQAANRSLAGLVKRYTRELSAWTFQVDGYCASFGPAESARDLSAARAATIAQLLRSARVRPKDIATRGHGFDRLAEPAEPSTSSAQRVVIVKLFPR